MPKLSQIGKHLALPSATLAFVFIAAGSVVTVATTATQEGSATATHVETAVTHAETAAPSSRLAEFCDQYWGELDEGGKYCRFSQWFHLNLRHAGSDLVATGIPILPGDTLHIEAAALPEALIGDEAYDASEQQFVAESAGYLFFRAEEGQSLFSVERLGLERCFADRDGKIDAAVCPGSDDLAAKP